MVAKVAVFDDKTKAFKTSSKFKAVEAGVDTKYAFGKDELKRSLLDYKSVYRQALGMFPARSEEAQENLELGESLSSWMAELVEERFQNPWIDEPDPGSAEPKIIYEDRFFAILKKEDKLKSAGTRHIYAIAAISTTTTLKGGASNDNYVEATVEFLVANPASQLKPDELKEAVNAELISKNISNVRGVGNFLTLKSLNRINKTSKLVQITTIAINPRSAAIASRSGAKLT